MASQPKDHRAANCEPGSAAGDTQPCAPTVRPAPGSDGVGRDTGTATGLGKALCRVVRPDELAARRERKARDRASVDRFVKGRLQALEFEEQFVIPRLYVVITGSLGLASALRLIEAISEGSLEHHGTPWVHMPEELWTSYCALSAGDWRAARATLRGLGLIDERSHYDVDRDQVITELAFMPEQFSSEVARVRERIREDALSEVRQGRSL